MMNILKITITLSLFFGLMVTGLAQENDKKMRKELVKVMKELPAETQEQILKYAIRKRDAIKAAEEKMAAQKQQAAAATPAVAAKAAGEQKKAVAQPQKAIKAEPKEVTLKPASSNPSAIKPVQPAHPQAQEAVATTTVEWYEGAHNFGKIDQGSVAKHTFKFKNTGDTPLKLTRVKASCGCTTPKWTREPIAPGEEGFIDVAFNSAGKSGPQSKTVTVSGNFGTGHKILRFTGEVVRPAAANPEKK